MDPRTRQLTASTKLVVRLILVALLAGAVFLVPARESKACVPTDPPPPSASERLQKSPYVFAGKIVKAFPGERSELYEFKVEVVWRGPLHETAFLNWTIGEFFEGSSCSYTIEPLSVGTEYLVYVNRGAITSLGLKGDVAHEWRTSWAIAELGEGQPPVRGTSGPVPPIVRETRAMDEQAAARRPFIVGAVAVLSVLAAGGLALRIRAALRRRNQQS